MAIIYTYPPISDLQLDDLVVVTDKSNKNSTRQASISQILDLSPPVVDSLNGFTGDVNIIAGSNISVDNITGQNNIQISTSSNTISSGNNGEFAFFAGTGSNLEGSPLLTTSSNRVYLQDYIYHKDNVGANDARFGFNVDNSFLVYLDDGAQERLTLSNDSFAVWTGLNRKIAAGSTDASLYHELDSVDPTKSQRTLTTTERGVRVSTTFRSDTPGSEFDFGGQIQFSTSASSSTYVGLMGPITSELTANYNLMLPNTPPTSGQLLAAGATLQGTSPNQYRKLEWIDGGSAVGVTQIIAGNNISISPTSGIGNVTVSADSQTVDPGGNNTQMQYNDGGAFGGTSGLTWDDSTNILSIDNRFEGDIDGALLQKVIAKEPLSKGDIVFISGGTGSNPEVRKAIANSPSTMPALGIMKEDVALDATGECVTSGEITGLGTLLNPFSTGDELFVSDISAGKFTDSAPRGEDNLIQKIGKVIKGGGGGALTVLGAFRTNAVPNLNEGSLFVGDSNDQSTTLSIGNNGQVLTSNGSTVTWQNPTIGITWSGSTAKGIATYSNANTSNVSSNLTIDDANIKLDIGSKYSLQHDSGILKIGSLSSSQDQEGIGFYINGSQEVLVNADGILETNAGIENAVDTQIKASRSTITAGVASAPIYVVNTSLNSGGPTNIASKVSGTGQRHIEFYNSIALVGSITTTTSGTSYNTTSDYRLKENVTEMTGSIDRVKQLKPSRFNFISDTNKIVDGFLAHEAALVVPESVTGDKDQVDEDGNPIYQGIDQSKLVPLLVGAIKELTARIEALEAK